MDVSINIAPPVLPVYEQPLCPTEGYLWTPGYWDYADAGYYWVPGVWVAPPRLGFLWTPGYWGFGDGLYVFHRGYWGPTIGFYGGVNYGYGYGGYGYDGGRWEGDHFRYNTAVTRVNTTVIHNTYVDKTVIKNYSNNRASFNGPGGVSARPDSRQLAAEHATHIAPTSEQVAHREAAGRERRSFTPASNARPAEARHDENHDRVADRPANYPASRAEQKVPRNGLSPEEQALVDRRQRQSANPERTRDEALRARGDEEAAPRKAPREGNPYGDRPAKEDRRAYAEPHAAKPERPPQAAERKAEKDDNRKGDDHKHDKNGGAPY